VTGCNGAACWIEFAQADTSVIAEIAKAMPERLLRVFIIEFRIKKSPFWRTRPLTARVTEQSIPRTRRRSLEKICRFLGDLRDMVHFFCR
jgi:hypothetical protein